MRQRIKRGILAGIKTDAGWLVDMVATNQQPTTDRLSTGATNQPTDHQPTIDLAPLVDHIAMLEDQVQRLTEASTMWQIRARQAEEQLKALTAGTSELEPAPESVESPETSETASTGVPSWHGGGGCGAGRVLWAVIERMERQGKLLNIIEWCATISQISVRRRPNTILVKRILGGLGLPNLDHAKLRLRQ
ncbi:MAG: hypothetical protein M3457_17885 [Chloroflexota bacterium]|nr:hypothetical protein [Chloroflexota bacterium]